MRSSTWPSRIPVRPAVDASELETGLRSAAQLLESTAKLFGAEYEDDGSVRVVKVDSLD